MEKGRVLGIPVVRPLATKHWVTREDLQKFKQELLVAIHGMLVESKTIPTKKWLKTYEVKKILGISSGTLQTLRSNGTIPFSKIGGILYYDEDEINKVVEQRKRGYFKNWKPAS